MSGLLNLLGYMADLAILATYFLMSRQASRVRYFHIANTLGCIPLAILEIQARLWQPLLLGIAFGSIGAYGWFADVRSNRLTSQPKKC